MKLYMTPDNEIRAANLSDVTVAVYGLGKMGLPLAVTFALKGFHVIGVDINETVVKKINKGESPVVGEANLELYLKQVIKNKKLKATTDLIKASKNSDIKIILVPTYLDDNNRPDMSIVQSVTEKIAKGLNRGDIVISECTLPPGTTMNLIGKTLAKISGLKLNKDFGVAHCPERTSSGTAIADIMGRLNPKIVGGADDKTTKAVEWIYSQINSRGVIPVKNTTVAEMVKVTEGIYRDLNIALSNNIYLISREIGIDANEVIKAANTDAVCHLLSPGPGVGGHCIPVYPYFILNKIKNNRELLTLSRKVNDDMSQHVISLVKEVLQEKKIHFKNANILVLGIAYRGGVKETRKSPGLKITKELIELSDNIYVYDPMFNKLETEQYGLKYKKDFANIDCIVITTNHKEFKNLDWKLISGKVRTKTVVDTVNILDADMMKKFQFRIRRIGYAL